MLKSDGDAFEINVHECDNLSLRHTQEVCEVLGRDTTNTDYSNAYGC